MKNRPFLQRLTFAWAGLLASWQSERSIRAHIIALCGVLVLLIVTRPKPIWWAVFILVSAAVIALELVNTAVERLSDHLHPEHHEVLKTVKDILAAAVMVLSIAALTVLGAFIGELIWF